MTSFIDTLIKKPLFGCQQCGQCLLSQTSYVCPMNCPKGLRNGPCGGTLGGKCEVLPDQDCVWINVHDRGGLPAGLRAPLNRELIKTSSVGNFVTGRDRATRLPAHLEIAEPMATSSLARKVALGEPVITLEINSPRTSDGLPRIARFLEPLRGLVDAVNTTSGAAGKPSLHSLETAEVVRDAGLEAVVQFCGRDHTPEGFKGLADKALSHGHRNFLLLTGDWNPGLPGQRNAETWFSMDSLQMVDIMSGLAGNDCLPYVGVASNPYTTPLQASAGRYAAKCQVGAMFTQTQAVTETEAFSIWLDEVRTPGSPSEHRGVIASIPLVGKEGPWKILQRLPGVYVSPVFRTHLNATSNIEKTGLELARRMIRDLFVLGIDGVHLMNFGVSAEALADLIQETREMFRASAA